MEREIRKVYYDRTLEVEAYYFKGIVQKFPDHFHEHYVIGAIESGRRWAWFDGERHLIEPGDLLAINPHQVHACEQVGEYPLDWRCINVKRSVMERTVQEITGRAFLPRFSPNILPGSEYGDLVREVYALVSGEDPGFGQEEAFFLLIEQLLESCSGEFLPPRAQGDRAEIRSVCDYLERHYADSITLDELARLAGLSKYYLLRAFTRQKGISPYRYLETVRIDRAKRLLEQGAMPADAAADTGFSDQSHFTKFFKNLIGLTPRQYREVFRGGGGAP